MISPILSALFAKYSRFTWNQKVNLSFSLDRKLNQKHNLKTNCFWITYQFTCTGKVHVDCVDFFLAWNRCWSIYVQIFELLYDLNDKKNIFQSEKIREVYEIHLMYSERSKILCSFWWKAKVFWKFKSFERTFVWKQRIFLAKTIFWTTKSSRDFWTFTQREKKRIKNRANRKKTQFHPKCILYNNHSILYILYYSERSCILVFLLEYSSAQLRFTLRIQLKFYHFQKSCVLHELIRWSSQRRWNTMTLFFSHSKINNLKTHFNSVLFSKKLDSKFFITTITHYYTKIMTYISRSEIK